MNREEKKQIIDSLAQELNSCPNFYLADASGLNAENTAKLRRMCFEKDVKLIVVKNKLFIKALEATEKADADLVSVLKGSTAVMFSETANVPARLIKDFKKLNKDNKPNFKAAYVQECVYVGEQNLETLVNIKSREELIGDIVGLLQSPMKNVISALTSSGGGKVAGLVKALSER